MAVGWVEAETNRHQDHVIAHVVGATPLGYFVADEAFHLVLDIGFIWTILVDGEMSLLPEKIALAELNISEDSRELLTVGIRELRESDEVTEPKSITRAPEGCLIEAVGFYRDEDGRRCRFEICGEQLSLCVEASSATGEFVANCF